MAIKLIAVDMDGTFLDHNQSYNRKRFSEQYSEMKKQGIKFIVASGNQYYQLKSFFTEIEEQIAFIAENGAYIVDEGKDIYNGEMSKETINKVLNMLKQYDYPELVVCGKNGAYVHASVTEEFYQQTLRYYHQLSRISDFEKIDDTIFKFATSFPEDMAASVLDEFHKHVGKYVTPVSSGHGDIDLIIPGIHKARGIKLLQERWGIADEETAAFGDSGNDLEMISHVKYGVAMSNAIPAIKDAAMYITSSNNNEGVLDAIDLILARKSPFY
ncbi:Cof-type HAD-IIB family hydrolase [Paenibacillus sp. DCT19]|uniref:Cof-type HAD-IIB family hydrolase n=1 Tax=Paenibacillus sp. DCT19 TaxID=2211212 RepID=UPI000FE272EC|nr:Cof-type HAD-IIB family hydrolase [Paenibacillus sp. DCT19]